MAVVYLNCYLFGIFHRICLDFTSVCIKLVFYLDKYAGQTHKKFGYMYLS